VGKSISPDNKTVDAEGMRAIYEAADGIEPNS